MGVQATDETRRMETETVTVNVTNVDEDGTVELLALRPQSGHGLHRHPGRSRRGHLQRQVAVVQVPVPRTGLLQPHRQGHVGHLYARRTATLVPTCGRRSRTTDPEGEGKTAKMESDYTVQAVRGNNMAPEFAADQNPNMPEAQARLQRGLWRRTQSAGSTVGDPVTADPKDGDVLTYTLEDGDVGVPSLGKL